VTGPVGIEIEETEGANLGRVEAGTGQTCTACGGTSYTGPQCTRCTFASRPSPPWPMVGGGYEPSSPEDGSERAELVPPEFVCPASGCDHAVPGPVADLRDLAIIKHWKVRVRHSRGQVMGGNGKQLDVADMWTVRFQRPGWMGYASRRGDAWDSVCVTGRTLPPFLALGVTDLKEWLAQPDQPAEWYDKIRKRVADGALASKVVKCPGPGACVVELVGQAFRPLRLEPYLWPMPDHTHRGNGDIKIKTSKKEKVAGL
jgi:hypothetical protein